jgi:hypothetical protein
MILWNVDLPFFRIWLTVSTLINPLFLDLAREYIRSGKERVVSLETEIVNLAVNHHSYLLAVLTYSYCQHIRPSSQGQTRINEGIFEFYS